MGQTDLVGFSICDVNMFGYPSSELMRCMMDHLCAWVCDIWKCTWNLGRCAAPDQIPHAPFAAFPMNTHERALTRPIVPEATVASETRTASQEQQNQRQNTHSQPDWKGRDRRGSRPNAQPDPPDSELQEFQCKDSAYIPRGFLNIIL